ncbi:MAG: AAA family ATPase, partial [Chloroflexi bacterium]|nr:AAA family ATPase [Chloroflexota bacterium]
AIYQPNSARFKVYLIDEVHRLSKAASEALLKILEEPPPHVVFILATTDPEELPATVLSRCQRFDFRRVSVDDMVSRLRQIAESEEIEIPDDALRLISREATGSLRDGVNLLDQVWVMCGSSVTLEAAQEALGLSPDARAMELASAALRGELAEGLAVLSAVQEDAIDFGRFKRQVVTHLRHALLTLTGATGTLSLSGPEMERLAEVCQGVEASAAVTALKAFSEADVRRDPYQPLPLELALAAIVYGPAAAAATASPASAPPQRQQRPQRSDAPRRQQSQRREQQATRNLPRVQGQGQPQQSVNEQAPKQQAPPPARTPQPASAPRSSDATTDLLEQIRTALRRRNQGLIATMLNGSCRIVEQSEDTLTLGFLPNYQQVHMQKVSEAASEVGAAASEVLKRRVSVRCVAFDGATTAGDGDARGADRATAQQATPRQPKEGVMQREARSRCGARPYQSN